MTKRIQPELVQETVTSALYDLMGRALESQSVEASEETSHYLLTLLSGFTRVDPERLSRALGPEYLSVSDLEPATRYVRMKEVADTSLFLSGIFLDYVEAQLPATEYFFDLGSSAYLYLGSIDEKRLAAAPLADTFNDLGRRFEDFARVLSAIADAELFPSDRRKLSLYSRWLREGTGRDARRLTALGVIPATDDDGSVH